MKRIVFKNHLNIDIYLYEDIFDSIIEKDAKKTQLIEALEDYEDVQNVYANFDISDEDMAALGE